MSSSDNNETKRNQIAPNPDWMGQLFYFIQLFVLSLYYLYLILIYVVTFWIILFYDYNAILEDSFPFHRHSYGIVVINEYNSERDEVVEKHIYVVYS